MGEAYELAGLEFNGSVKVEARSDRLSSDAGALALREAAQRLGLLDWLMQRLNDPRDPDRVTHPLPELLTTMLVLFALGWRDQDDADALRHDPVLRLAVSSRRGVSPLTTPTEDGTPDGLASQPTLSRLVAALSTDGNRAVMREALTVVTGRRIRAMRRGRRYRSLTIDVDSFDIPVHGQQDGAEYNGHFHRTVYHPLIASIGETGDIVDMHLRHGRAHTAEGALDFILPLLDRVERDVCQVACVRVDAGFPSEPLLAGLEDRGRPTPYVARIRNNPRLNRMAAPYLVLPPRPDNATPRTWLYEMSYKAGSWSRERRVILVVDETPGELFANHFWLVTSWSPEQMTATDVLALYRERGKAEARFGEFKSVLDPALSSTRRRKSHYRGEEPADRTRSRDPMATNEVTLLLHALAYNLMHALRTLLEAKTGHGWSLMRLRERALKVAARVLVHGRRATVVVATCAARLWATMLGALVGLGPPSPQPRRS